MAPRWIPLVLENDFEGQKALIGRRQTPKEVRDLIFGVTTENPDWGARGIHGELLMLGFDVSERTISRWMQRASAGSRPFQTLAYFST